MPEIPKHIRDKILSRSNYAVEEKLARRVRASLGLRPASLVAVRTSKELWGANYHSEWEIVRGILYDLLSTGGKKQPLHPIESRCVQETHDLIRVAYPPEKGLSSIPTFFVLYPGGGVSVVTLMLRDNLPNVTGKFSVTPFHGLIVVVDRPLEDFAGPLKESADAWRRHHEA